MARPFVLVVVSGRRLGPDLQEQGHTSPAGVVGRAAMARRPSHDQLGARREELTPTTSRLAFWLTSPLDWSSARSHDFQTGLLLALLPSSCGSGRPSNDHSRSGRRGRTSAGWWKAGIRGHADADAEARAQLAREKQG